jgi:hypothetical protein
MRFIDVEKRLLVWDHLGRSSSNEEEEEEASHLTE